MKLQHFHLPSFGAARCLECRHQPGLLLRGDHPGISRYLWRRLLRHVVWHPGGSREGGKGGCCVKQLYTGGEVEYDPGSNGTFLVVRHWRLQVLKTTARKWIHQPPRTQIHRILSRLKATFQGSWLSGKCHGRKKRGRSCKKSWLVDLWIYEINCCFV